MLGLNTSTAVSGLLAAGGSQALAGLGERTGELRGSQHDIMATAEENTRGFKEINVIRLGVESGEARVGSILSIYLGV